MDNVQKSGTGDVCPGKKNKLELSEVREKLSEARGPQYWRTLDELAQTPEFAEMLHREFPKHASEWNAKNSRRDFLKIMGASLALAGLSACTKQPLEPIVPYVKQPNNLVLGKPLFYATAMPLGATARACWRRVTKAVRRRSRAIRNTHLHWAEPTSSTKPAC